MELVGVTDGVTDEVGVMELVGVTDEVGVTELVGVTDEVGVIELVGVTDEVGVMELVGVTDFVGVGVGVGSAAPLIATTQETQSAPEPSIVNASGSSPLAFSELPADPRPAP